MADKDGGVRSGLGHPRRPDNRVASSGRRRHSIGWRLAGWFLALALLPLLATVTVTGIGGQFVAHLAVVLAVVAMGVAWAVWSIVRPIQALAGAAERVGDGDLDVVLPLDGLSGELESLAVAFNDMTRRLKASHLDMEGRVERRTRAEQRRADQLAVISEMGRHITTVGTVDELLGEVVRLSAKLLGYSSLRVGLIEGDEVVYRAGEGPGWGLEGVAHRLKVGQQGISGRVAATGVSILAADVTLEPAYLVDPAFPDTRSELVVPLKTKRAVVGVLDVQSNRADAFDDTDRVVLESLGIQVAVAIENLRLRERTRRLAILEERQRLARDLHDSVTQALYGVTLYAEAAYRLLESGDPEKAAGYIAEVRGTARESLREMRLLIFELRPPMLDKMGLVAALRSRLEAVEGRAGVRFELSADDEIDLTSEEEEAMYRISLEALNNALKHAGAERIWVRLARSDGRVEMVVADDGRGFDPAVARERAGFGIAGMEERAAGVGAELEVRSTPGEGTVITVRTESAV